MVWMRRNPERGEGRKGDEMAFNRSKQYQFWWRQVASNRREWIFGGNATQEFGKKLLAELQSEANGTEMVLIAPGDILPEPREAKKWQKT